MNKSIVIIAGAVASILVLAIACWTEHQRGYESGIQAERSRAVRLKAAKYSVVVDKDSDTPRFDFSYNDPVVVQSAPQVSPLDEARKEITALTELMAAQDKVRQQIKAEIIPLPPVVQPVQPVQAPAPPAPVQGPPPQVKAESRPPVIEPPAIIVKESEILKPTKFEKVIDKNPPVLDALIEPLKPEQK